jgi:hypothetical protein
MITTRAKRGKLSARAERNLRGLCLRRCCGCLLIAPLAIAHAAAALDGGASEHGVQQRRCLLLQSTHLVLRRHMLLIVLRVLERVQHARLSKPMRAEVLVERETIIAREITTAERALEDALRDEIRREHTSVEPARMRRVASAVERRRPQSSKWFQRDRVSVGQPLPPERF